MKIAVVGMGVAGSYLMNRLGHDNEVVGFERYPKRRYQCVCAWGTSKDYIRDFVKDCDLDFDDYVLTEGRTLHISMGGIEATSPLSGLVSFDKHRLLGDMRKRSDVRYGTWISSQEDLKGYDLIVDATGLRVLLPKIRGRETRVPCVQYTVTYEDPPFDDFYLKVFERFTGYLWYFPLGEKVANVGAGDLGHRHVDALDEFFSRYGGKRAKIVGRALRLMPPKHCLPFESGRVVGVGESIGTVFPLLGEGIIPTLQCSELLVKNVGDLQAYRRKVLRQFAFFETAFEFLEPFFRGEVGVLNQARLTLDILAHLWENQSRYGFKLQVSDLRIEPLSFIQQALTVAGMLRI